MNDSDIDARLPAAARRASARYWTHAAIARRVATFFSDLGAKRVLDVGSGPGKFCVAAAAHASGLSFVGVEHRPHLVQIARGLAKELSLDNVTFRGGDVTRMPWTDFDGLYVYNSFAENGFSPREQYDHTVELSARRRAAEIHRVGKLLARAPVGTVLVTYHGLGGPIPDAYERVHAEPAGTGWLQVWRRRRDETTDLHWLEDDADIRIVRAGAATKT